MRTHEVRLVFCIGTLLYLIIGSHSDSSTATPQASLAAIPSVTPSPRDATTAASQASLTATPSVTPSPSSSPPQCSSGPEFIAVMGLLTTDKLYIDLSEPIECSGVIVRWEYCHYVLGFRGTLQGIWPSIWQRAENDSTYSLIGVNKIKIIPGNEEDSTVRCGSYTPQPGELIKVEEGQYVGFFLPDTGLFVALSSIDHDPGNFQLERESFGFTDFLNESELINASTVLGRALLKAIVDPAAVLPSIATSTTSALKSATHSPTPTVTMDTELVAAVAVPVALIAAVASAACVVALLVLIIGCLVCYVLRKRKTGGQFLRSGSKSASLEYNNLYLCANRGDVVVNGKKTTMNIRDNPAYAGFGPTLGLDPRDSRDFDHTYESISSVAVHRVHSVRGPGRPES